MLITFEKAAGLINQGKLLHIAGMGETLQKLPKGNWIGGSTEYFMSDEGGKTSDDLLFVTDFDCEDFKIKAYTTRDIENVAVDAFDNGYSIVIIPFDSTSHKDYAENAAGYEGMFIKKIVGWISGINLGKDGQIPIVLDGSKGEMHANRAVVLHLQLPEDKMAHINIINIFEPDENSPIIEFDPEGFTVKTCLIGGKEALLADYIAQNNIDQKIPLVADYSGSYINVSIKSIQGDTVNLYAPVFSGIKYRFAKPIPDYAKAFSARLADHPTKDIAFTCNCILNFLYGELEGKNTGVFTGPITFGEIAYELVNQTLVYVDIN
jgi:hypothetical protein